MSHYLRIDDDYDEIRLALVCTAAPGSPCRLRPADGHQSRTLTDTIAAEVLRQKADAWDEGKAAGLSQSDWEHGDTAGMYIARNPYRATPPTTTREKENTDDHQPG